jgi:hypothetical protein
MKPIGRFSPPIGRPTISSWGGDGLRPTVGHRADLMGKGCDQQIIDRRVMPGTLAARPNSFGFATCYSADEIGDLIT